MSYTVELNFLNVTSITFSSGATDSCSLDDKGNLRCENNQGNARFDALELKHDNGSGGMGEVPLPAGMPLMLAGLGAMAFLARRKARKA
jgi:hypothetical protein